MTALFDEGGEQLSERGKRVEGQTPTPSVNLRQCGKVVGELCVNLRIMTGQGKEKRRYQGQGRLVSRSTLRRSGRGRTDMGMPLGPSNATIWARDAHG